MDTTSQRAAIIRDLQDGKGITPYDALQDYGCARLAARINDLRKEGYPVVTETVIRGRKKFARYVLPQPTQPSLF